MAGLHRQGLSKPERRTRNVPRSIQDWLLISGFTYRSIKLWRLLGISPVQNCPQLYIFVFGAA